MLSLVPLALCQVLSATPTPAPSPAPQPLTVIVLKGGVRYRLSRPFQPSGKTSRLNLVNGSLLVVPTIEIDFTASQQASRPVQPALISNHPTTDSAPSPLAAAASCGPRSTTTPRPTAVVISLESSGSSPSVSPSSPSSSGPSSTYHGPVAVRGYTRRDGTYVAPHTRSAPKK